MATTVLASIGDHGALNEALLKPVFPAPGAEDRVVHRAG
jgi:hypothetical protein